MQQQRDGRHLGPDLRADGDAAGSGCADEPPEPLIPDVEPSTLNRCAELRYLSASPLQTAVGYDVHLFAEASDAEGDDIAFRWSATGGEVSSGPPTAGDAGVVEAATTYTCSEEGAQTISVEISDNELGGCADERTTFVGLANYAAAVRTDRFWEALLHTGLFTALTVTLEVVLGLVLALALDRIVRGRGFIRATVLLPWAVPTVVAALIWQFLFADTGLVNSLLGAVGVTEQSPAWFGDAVLAWVPVILADVWKTTPFAALLLLAGLQNIDEGLYEAARADGARPRQQLWHITLPLLRPALLVVLVFRTLDALRVFDLIVVLTGGGPGTPTEPIALYTFQSLLQHLRFGYGSALSVVAFALSFGFALAVVRLLGRDVTKGAR